MTEYYEMNISEMIIKTPLLASFPYLLFAAIDIDLNVVRKFRERSKTWMERGPAMFPSELVWTLQSFRLNQILS